MSRFKTCSLCLVLCAMGAVTLAQEQPYVMVLPGDVEWGPATPKLPPGAEIAVLIGDPSKAGIPYVFRARLPDGYSVPPHWHPMDENVTVIEGIMMLGFGERVDRAAMRELVVGSYVTLPKEMPHYNRMKGETILQFHGIGPYDITYVNPADDPSRISSGFDFPATPDELDVELHRAREELRKAKKELEQLRGYPH